MCAGRGDVAQQTLKRCSATERNGCNARFVIADVSFNRGYCSQQRITDKQAKYSPLAQSLRARGWAVRCVAAGTCAFPHPSPNDEPTPLPPLHLTDIAVISLGTTGELYTSTLNSLKALYIDKARLAPLLSSLHLLAIKHAASITRVRRKLDSLQRPGAPTGAPRRTHRVVCGLTRLFSQECARALSLSRSACVACAAAATDHWRLTVALR